MRLRLHTQERSALLRIPVSSGRHGRLNPHILILDEPTNYLDRDGLGALTLAIRDFEGGVRAAPKLECSYSRRRVVVPYRILSDAR